MNPNQVRKAVYVPRNLYNRVQAILRRRGDNFSAWVRRKMAELIESEEKQKPDL